MYLKKKIKSIKDVMIRMQTMQFGVLACALLNFMAIHFIWMWAQKGQGLIDSYSK